MAVLICALFFLGLFIIELSRGQGITLTMLGLLILPGAVIYELSKSRRK